MSYPDARYLGAMGEISARYRTADERPELTRRSVTASYLATGASTNGQFGLYRWDMAGPPSGPDAHFHRSISESFFVLSGVIRLFNGERWIDATAGDFLYVPRRWPAQTGIVEIPKRLRKRDSRALPRQWDHARHRRQLPTRHRAFRRVALGVTPLTSVLLFPETIHPRGVRQPAGCTATIRLRVSGRGV
jgi:mannose-6-phosphate isomerase-like protein (cupin superfamily)